MSKKAFTLIELMIVVVILWVLMSTILPKLTWAQARARDTARISDLWNISAALQTYYDDNWEYPHSSWSTVWECLNSSWWDVASALKIYMQNEVVPTDPQNSANQHLCNTNNWRYYYMPLTKDGLSYNAFTLCADMETYQKANTNASSLVWNAPWEAPVVAWTPTNTYEWAQDDVDALKTNSQKESVDTNAAHTVYCILRP